MTTSPLYNVFTRTWWRRNPAWPNGKEPGPSKKRYLAYKVSFQEARRICQEFNETNDPGPLSLKAEFEQA